MPDRMPDKYEYEIRTVDESNSWTAPQSEGDGPQVKGNAVHFVNKATGESMVLVNIPLVITRKEIQPTVV